MSDRMSAEEALNQIAQHLEVQAQAYGATLRRKSTWSSGMDDAWTFHTRLELSIADPVPPPLGPPLDLGVQVAEIVHIEDKAG